MQITSSISQLGTVPVGKLLIKYATPAIIAMTASSLYNIIDAIFIGQGVGPLAIAGISLSFPVMQLTNAFGAMIGVGAGTLLSVKLGEKDYTSARRILGNVVSLNIVMGVVIGLLMLIFLDPILFFFGASNETVSYAREFMTIILLGNVITHLYLGFNSILRSSGHPREAMFATVYSVLINLIFAPLFIYVFKWGISGAAFATVMSQTIVLLYEINILRNKNEFIHFESGTFSFQKNIVIKSMTIGLSPFLINLCGCFVSVFINWSLTHYGNDLDIAAFGITNRLTFLFLMIVIGLTQAMQPIVGYNYGAKNYLRARKTFLYTISAASVVVGVGFLISVFFAEECAMFFTNDLDLIKKSAESMRIIFVIFPVIGFQIVTSNFYQCIGKVNVSIFLSLTRQLLFLLPMLYILPMFYGVKGVWMASPGSDFLATLTTLFFFINILRKFNKDTQQN